MLIQSHYLFANYIFEQLEQYGYAHLLCKKSYVLGNLLPDLDLNLKEKNHSIHGTPSLIADQIKKLRSSSDIQEFSEHLGIMTHYLCDSFCAYHNRDSLINESFIKHLQYESKLHKKLKKRIAKNKLKPFINYSRDHTLENVFLLILSHYYTRDIKPSRDIRYALGVSIIFAEKLLQEKRKEQSFIQVA